METKVVYFEYWGPENTLPTFDLVRERLAAGDVKKIVLASTTGETAGRALDYFEGSDVKLVVVPHQWGFRRSENRFPAEMVERVREAGHEVHFGTMLFHTENLYGTTAPALLANILRCFSQGTKVCFEIVMMATDGGKVALGEKVIAVAGTGGGSDTALVMTASSSFRPDQLRVHELICKPLNPLNIQELRERRAGAET